MYQKDIFVTSLGFCLFVEHIKVKDIQNLMNKTLNLHAAIIFHFFVLQALITCEDQVFVCNIKLMKVSFIM